jgi:hypothetical protein
MRLRRCSQEIPPARTSPPPLLRGAKVKSNIKIGFDLTPLTRGSLPLQKHPKTVIKDRNEDHRSGGISQPKPTPCHKNTVQHGVLEWPKNASTTVFSRDKLRSVEFGGETLLET